MRHRVLLVQKVVLCLAVSLMGYGSAQAQDEKPSGVYTQSGSENLPPIPVLTGGLSMESRFVGADRTMKPVIGPIVLVPLGKRALLETEFEVESEMTWTNGQRQPITVSKSLEYAQVDYFLAKNMTVVLGRFATPFGFYKERNDARWIRNLQESPLIFGFSDSSNNGAELRGTIPLNEKLRLTYITYFSTQVNNLIAGSDRQTGFRTALFDSRRRMELGMSFQRKLSGERFNAYGTDFNWNLRQVPVDLRSEVLISNQAGKGYWAEAAWRMSNSRNPAWLRRAQLVARGEQFFAPASAGPGDQITADRIMGGLNYRVTDLVRAQAGFGRQFHSADDNNIFTFALNFRFVE